MQHGDVVAQHRGLADDDAGAVVEEDPLPDHRRGVDVDLEEFGDPALQIEGHGLAALGPQPVADPVRLQRQEALEEQERLDVALAGRIALEHGLQVGLGGGDDGGIGLIGFLGHLAQAHGPQLLVAEFARELVGQGVGDAGMADHHRVQQRGETGLGLGHVLRFITEGRPDRRRGGYVNDFQVLDHRETLPRTRRSTPISPADFALCGDMGPKSCRRQSSVVKKNPLQHALRIIGRLYTSAKPIQSCLRNPYWGKPPWPFPFPPRRRSATPCR